MPDNSAFKNSLGAAADQIVKELQQNVTKAALLVEGEAKKNCPVDEGLLRASITHEVKTDGQKITGYIGSNLDYAPYVHYGTGIYAENGQGRKTPWIWYGDSVKWRGGHWTKGQKPKPFLREAMTKNKSKIEKILAGKS